MIRTVTDMSLKDRIRKLILEEVNTAPRAQHRSHPRSFSNSIREGRDRSHWWSTSRRRSRRGQSLVVTSATGQQTGCLLYVTDRESRLRFLVDTGSEVNIIPPTKAKRKNRQDTFGLLAAKRFANCDLRDPLAHDKSRTTSHLPMGVHDS